MAEAGIAHGALDANHILVRPDGTIRLVDLGAAVAAAPRALLQADRAQLLVTTALIAGPDRAVDVAVGQLGADGLGELLPYLQPAALTAGSRRVVRAGPDRNLSSLRTLAAGAAGRQPPALAPLRRVTWASLLRAALLAFGVWFLVSSIAGLGLSTIVEELENASGAWLGVALLLAQLAVVSQALSTVGASPKPLRLGPAILLQYAIAFLAVATPSSAARVALDIRFFQRSGLPAASAIAVAVPRLRRMLADRLVEARETLSVLRQPTKLAQLFGGNLAARIALAMVLSACLHAFGQPVPLGPLVVVNTVAGLFAGLMPVPAAGRVRRCVDGRAGVDRHPRYGGARRGADLPDGHVLPSADLGWFAMRALKRAEYL